MQPQLPILSSFGPPIFLALTSSVSLHQLSLSSLHLHLSLKIPQQRQLLALQQLVALVILKLTKH
jgi:hypothetical protein